MNNFQREGSISNSHVGREFEQRVKEYFLNLGVVLEEDVKVKIGIEDKKNKSFDLGSLSKNILVECKAHTWTRPNYGYPSAKINNWISEMYKFYLTPKNYRKILIVQYDYNSRLKESLLEHFIRLNKHLIPEDVELMDYDLEHNRILSRS